MNVWQKSFTGMDFVVHAQYSNLLYLSVFIFILWLCILGRRLYMVWKKNNPTGDFSKWIETETGSVFLEVVVLPITPIIFPLVLLFALVDLIFRLIERIIACLRNI